MTQFEKLIRETTTLQEALLLQPCLSDEKESWFIEGIRYAFIEENFGISAMPAALMKLMIEKSRAKAFEAAIAKDPPAKMIAMAICSHGWVVS